MNTGSKLLSSNNTNQLWTETPHGSSPARISSNCDTFYDTSATEKVHPAWEYRQKCTDKPSTHQEPTDLPHQFALDIRNCTGKTGPHCTHKPRWISTKHSHRTTNYNSLAEKTFLHNETHTPTTSTSLTI